MSTDYEEPSALAATLRRWPLIVLIAILAASAAAGASAYLPPVWTGTASVVYTGSSSSVLTGESPNSDTIARTVASEALVAGSDRVLSSAADKLQISARTLKKATVVSNPADSNILVLEVTASSARLAAIRAQAVANAYLSYNQKKSQDALEEQAAALDPSLQRLQEQLRVRQPATIRQTLQSSYASTLQKQVVLSAAAGSEQGPARSLSNGTPPTNPSSPSVATSAALGAGLGFAIGFALLFFLVTAYPRHWARVKPPRRPR